MANTRNEQDDQIDHIVVCKRCTSFIENVRTYQGPNCDSGHYLVGVKMKQKKGMVSITKDGMSRVLGNECVKEEYQVELNLRLQYQGHSNDIDEEWSPIKNSFIESANHTVSETSQPRNED